MRRLKIEFCDENGEQVTVALSGSVSKEKLFKLIELFEIKDRMCSASKTPKTIRERLLEIINSKLNTTWFTSKELASLYFEIFHESIKPSTISTYLSRLYNNGYLERSGNRSCWQYRLVTKTSKNVETFIKELYKK
ncbi:MAG: hypothetical protein QXW80_04740 [Candidatus Micrarchaeia archaeon]